MLRVRSISQRLCQLRFEGDDGPIPPLNPAELLRENDWRRVVEWLGGFYFEHARVLAGEQLPQKSTKGTKETLLFFSALCAFCGSGLTSSGHRCCSRFPRQALLF